MIRLLTILFICVLTSLAFSQKANAADMTFQFINDTERALSLKLFSRGADGKQAGQQWPGKTKAYSLRPDDAVQQLKIDCEEGEKICWGAWVVVQSVSGQISRDGERNTRTGSYQYGVGQKNFRECARCCQVCTAGKMVSVIKLASSSTEDVQAK
jgi:hypothetical protein